MGLKTRAIAKKKNMGRYLLLKTKEAMVLTFISQLDNMHCATADFNGRR
jgi:hypothetical protein